MIYPKQQQVSSAHWRDSARAAKFFVFDAKAVVPIFMFLLHIKIWTLIAAIIAMSFFTIIRRFGYSVETFLRYFRSFVSGKRKMAVPWWISRNF